MSNEEIMAEVLVDEYLATEDEHYMKVNYDGTMYYLNFVGGMWLNARLYLRQQEKEARQHKGEAQ